MKRFSNILLIADAAGDTSVALDRAVALAINNQASLTLVDIVDLVPAELQMAVTAVTPHELCEIAVTDKREKLDQIIESIANEEIAVETKVLVGKPFIEIIRQVLGNNYDLVIKCVESAASHKHVLFGSMDMHLMRKCPCPVWIIKSTAHPHYRRILAAVDQDPEDAVKDRLNRQILEMSTSLAMAEFSELHVVHAWQLAGEDLLRSMHIGFSDAEVDEMVEEAANKKRRWLENLVDTFGAKADKDAVDYLKPQLHLIEGDAKHIVPTAAREFDVDLVVMGTVARTGIAGFFMGNTAENILTQLDCSVLTVKPPGFTSPVTLEA
jgi:nucleotide-binding universal stress UspA family protein